VISYDKQRILTKQVKYLGVLHDSKLNWKAHVDAKNKKALAAFYQLRCVAGKTWGTSPKVIHWIYTTALHPMVCYAAVSWWTHTQYITVRKQLEHLKGWHACTLQVLKDRNDWKYNGVILNDNIVCYTDGSRIERTGLAGAGVYVETSGEELISPLDITPPFSRLKSLPC